MKMQLLFVLCIFTSSMLMIYGKIQLTSKPARKVAVRATTCTRNGMTYKNGSPVPDESPCKSCRCRYGSVRCYVARCAIPHCQYGAQAITKTGDCCPTCPPRVSTCLKYGVIYKDGSNVPDENPCKFCRCRKGEVRCMMPRCATRTCPNGARQISMRGVCCPFCPPKTSSCSVEGTTYKDGEKISFQDPCKSCVCRKAHVICQVPRCPIPICRNNARPIRKEGACCSVCPKRPMPPDDFDDDEFDFGLDF